MVNIYFTTVYVSGQVKNEKAPSLIVRGRVNISVDQVIYAVNKIPVILIGSDIEQC